MSRYVGFRHLLATIGQYIYIYISALSRGPSSHHHPGCSFFFVLISLSPLQFNEGAVKMAALCVTGEGYWSYSHHIQNTRTRWCTRRAAPTHTGISAPFTERIFWSSKRFLTLLLTASALLYGWLLRSALCILHHRCARRNPYPRMNIWKFSDIILL